MADKNVSIIKEYFNDYNTYQKKYGEKSIVLMQVGSFFEAYSTQTTINNKSVGEGPDLQYMASLLNIVCTRKDKSIQQIDDKNPRVMGFPLVATPKFVGILVDNGYTVIMKEQVTAPPNPERKVTNIYSPGTYIDAINTNESNNIVCIYFCEEVQFSGKYVICAGMSSIDISTGKTCVHNAIGDESDEMYAIDEVNRFINTLNPTEILIYYDDKKISKTKTKNAQMARTSKDNLLKKLDLSDRKYIFNDPAPIFKQKDYDSIKTQIHFFDKIYECEVLVSSLEYLEMDDVDYEYTRISFMFLLDFVKDHNNNILEDIEIPDKYMDKRHVNLENNAINQLDIINDNSKNKFATGNNIRSLFDVVNKTSTAMGHRLLRDRLVSPIINHKILKTIYDDTESLIKNNKYLEFETILNSIADIERLYRKMYLSKLAPYELAKLVDSICEAIKLVNLASTVHQIFPENYKIGTESATVEGLKSFVKDVESIFSLSELKKYSLYNISDSFFLPNVHKDIDKIKDKMINGNEFMKKLCNVLIDYLGDNNKQKQNRYEKISVRRNNNNEYYLKLSKVRAQILKNNLEDIESITIDDKEILITDLVFDSTNKNDTKITVPKLFNTYDTDNDTDTNTSDGNENNDYDNDNDNDNDSDSTNTDEKKIIKLTIKYYYETLTNLCHEYGNNIKGIVPYVAYIDFLKSNAKCSLLYKYTRPNIQYDANKGFVVAKQLRHPIVERIINYEFVPNDVNIGIDTKGILLYGINSSGKSVYMKAVGVSIIMAQSGLFVPASEFIYSPYESIFTRINGNDDLFRGLSSYTVEMLELKAIKKRANKKTLVIGDEICRGTENLSGNSIVAAAIIILSKRESSFIFATHLHEMSTMTRIKELKNVKSYHISVNVDKKTRALIYDRILKPGSGDPIYGVIVANQIIQDDEFNDLVLEIKDELMHNYNGIITGIKSRYNSSVHVDECRLCGSSNKKMHTSPLETHHIIQQKDFDNNNSNMIKPHIRKNDEANLTVLCDECHDKLHRGEYKIDGYVMTSKGRKLVTKIDDVKHYN